MGTFCILDISSHMLINILFIILFIIQLSFIYNSVYNENLEMNETETDMKVHVFEAFCTF